MATGTVVIRPDVMVIDIPGQYTTHACVVEGHLTGHVYVGRTRLRLEDRAKLTPRSNDLQQTQAWRRVLAWYIDNHNVGSNHHSNQWPSRCPTLSEFHSTPQSLTDLRLAVFTRPLYRFRLSSLFSPHQPA